MPQHSEARNYRVVRAFTPTGPFTGHGMDVSVVDRYCAGCDRWVEERGVIGWIRWQAEHGDHVVITEPKPPEG